MINLSHQTAVPQICIDGEMVIGFNEKLIREKLSIDMSPMTPTPTPPSPPTPPPPPSIPWPPVLLPSEPVLTSPTEGAIMDNGRFDGKDRLVWEFDWSDVPSASQYQIYVIGPLASNPVINDQVSYSSYRWVYHGTIGGGSEDHNRYGWTWKVRSLVNGLWSSWSQRTFDVEPVDTDPQAPVPVYPTPTPPPPNVPPPPTPIAQTLTLAFTTPVTLTSSEYLEIYKPMLDEIEQKSSGRIKFNVFPMGSIASATDQYDAIAMGVVDMGVPYFTHIADRFPLSGAFTFPAAYNMSNDGEDLIQALGDRIFALTPSETKILCYFQQQPYFLYTAHKRVIALDHLDGLKLRTTGFLQAEALETLGATPVSIPSAEIYTAIQLGIIDGTLVIPAATDSMKLTEVTKYVLRLPLGYSVGMININASTWSGIPDDLKPIFEGVAEETRYIFVKQFNVYDAKVNSHLTGQGGSVYTPSITELAQWSNAIKPVIDNWISDREIEGWPAQDLVDAIRIESHKLGVPFPY